MTKYKTLAGTLLGVMFPALLHAQTARVQVIHNSADAAAAEVDVYINDALALDNFAFRTATPFLDLPSGVDVVVGIAPANSTSSADAIANFTYNLADGGTYVLVASGIVSPTGYSPATAFDIHVAGGGLESSPAGTSSVLVFHGSTDAPTVQVAEMAQLGGAVIVPPFSYSEFAGYLEVPTLDFVLQVQLPDGTPVVSYAAPLETLGLDGAAMVVLASGFLNPANNSNGADFGLWVALPIGGDLLPLPIFTSIGENDLITGLTAFPNPASDLLTVDVNARALTQANMFITDAVGRVVMQIPTTSLASGQNRMTLPVNDLANGTYLLSIMAAEGVRTVPVQIVR